MRVVIEPGVLVAGIFAPLGPEGRLLDLVASECVTILYDDQLLEAYRQALARAGLERMPSAIEQLVNFLEQTGVAAAPTPRPRPLNGPLSLALAADGCADALVTCDARSRHDRSRRGVRICSAAELLAYLERRLWALVAGNPETRARLNSVR